jgi:serine/threonine-protein kinase
MPLSAGTRLGPYEIVSALGAGGMGEVYRACDPRMGRDVAIKVSAERFSDRFEREVRAVASLNHPNICHIYDVGPNYLVMELVEGPTLADRIKGGALPLEEALTIARQIAGALEAAHEKGIIHRDLKPANIKIKPDGIVKVVDFGLAKIAEATATAQNPENSPTLTIEGTRAGQVLGTAAYMSPEQARGRTVDKRADIWAFGVVLYEMLTARRLFHGETISDTLVAVLKEEPDWNRVPAKVQRLLRSCLEKEPKRRLRDIGDAWRLLEIGPFAPVGKNRLPWVVAGALALSLAIALWAPWRDAVTPIEHPLLGLDLDLGPDVSLGSSIGPAAVLSPDGTRLVFVSQAADRTSRLFTRQLNQPKAVPIPGTEGAYTPFFSPDGQWVAFFARGKLKKNRIDGAEMVTLCDAYAARGGSWGENGNIVAALDPQTTLARISAEGGKPISITELHREIGEFSHRWPQVLPGGETVLFTASTRYANFEEAPIAVVSLKDGKRKIVLEHGGMLPHYLPTGHLAYVTKGALFAVPFDLHHLEVRGSPVKLLEEVPNSVSIGFAQLDVSRSGALVYLTGKSEGLRTLQWLESPGTTTSLGADLARYMTIHLSPDGSRVATIASEGTSSNIWIYNWQRGGKSIVNKGLDAEGGPIWTPDGRFVIFQSAGGMSWTRSDGSGKPQLLTPSKHLQIPSSFSPDGTRLAYSELIPGAGAEIRIVRVETISGQLRAGDPETFLKTATVSSFPAFSPDGRWLAYANAEGGVYEVYVRVPRQWHAVADFEFRGRDTRLVPQGARGVLPNRRSTHHGGKLQGQGRSVRGREAARVVRKAPCEYRARCEFRCRSGRQARRCADAARRHRATRNSESRDASAELLRRSPAPGRESDEMSLSTGTRLGPRDPVASRRGRHG